MVPSCFLLSLPPELRNNIYEYAARTERTFHIKTSLRPRHGSRIASESALLLANRQISTEYLSTVQVVAFWPGLKLECTVHDFNFSGLEDFISTLSLSSVNALRQTNKLQVRLVISSLQNVETQHLTRWFAFCNQKHLNFYYYVNDVENNRLYPMTAPSSADLAPFLTMSLDGGQALGICVALLAWKQECGRKWDELLDEVEGVQVSKFRLVD